MKGRSLELQWKVCWGSQQRPGVKVGGEVGGPAGF